MSAASRAGLAAENAMLSHRLVWDQPPNRLAAALAARRLAGLPVIDLTEANPTRAGLAPPAKELRAALAAPGAHLYAPDPRGLPSARAAVAAYYAERGGPVDPARLFLTAGTSDGYAWLCKLLADPGDEILVPAPSYPLLPLLAELEGIRLVPYPLVWREGTGWRIDPEALAAAIGPRARALIVVSPHNPTGAVTDARERAALDALCARHGLALIVDEVFLDYPGDGAPDPLPSAAATDGEALTFVLSGLSKVAALPQVKLSWLVCGGPAPARARAQGGLELIADAYLSVGTPVQLATPALLALRHAAQARIRARLRENESWLRETCAGLGAGRLLPREAGWYALLECWTGEDEEEWCLARLEEDGLLLHPGYFFDFPRRGCLALSLLVPPAEFRVGAARLLRHLA
jgi:hypothetical protein